MSGLCAREREIFGEMRGNERRTTIPCRATIPKHIVEKILSQGGTGSARPGRQAQKIVSCGVKHLLHIGEKRREELIGGLPAQGAHREVVVLVHVSP